MENGANKIFKNENDKPFENKPEKQKIYKHKNMFSFSSVCPKLFSVFSFFKHRLKHFSTFVKEVFFLICVSFLIFNFSINLFLSMPLVNLGAQMPNLPSAKS